MVTYDVINLRAIHYHTRTQDRLPNADRPLMHRLIAMVMQRDGDLQTRNVTATSDWDMNCAVVRVDSTQDKVGLRF